jgi:hypothetical protein
LDALAAGVERLLINHLAILLPGISLWAAAAGKTLQFCNFFLALLLSFP